MKTAFAILTTLFCLTMWGQPAENAVLVFKVTNFDPDGQISDSGKKDLQTNGVLDLEFYRSNFYRPLHYPEVFINRKYKNQTVEIWSDTSKPKQISSNWAYSFVYDSLSRVILYSYSSCLLCGQQAYNIQITYDQLNRPVTFAVRHSFGKDLPESEKYLITYDDNNNIIQLKYFSAARLDEQIDKL